MARKGKEKAKPLFAVKGDFYGSLDALAQESLNFLFAVEHALQLDLVKEPAAGILKERVAAFRAALTTDD